MASEFKVDQREARRRLDELRRPPWDVLSSFELGVLLDVSIQVLANWRIRRKGPDAVPAGAFKGNRTYYRVYDIERWLRSFGSEVVESWEVVAEWLRARYYFPVPLETEDRTWCVAEQLRGWNIWPVKHRSRRAMPLAKPVK